MKIKFQEKIFNTKKVIKLWNFGNFGIPKIIPKSLVTLRFLKVSLHELEGIYKCFQMSYWPNFYVDPIYSNTCFFKVGKWRVSLQGTVCTNRMLPSFWNLNSTNNLLWSFLAILCPPIQKTLDKKLMNVAHGAQIKSGVIFAGIWWLRYPESQFSFSWGSLSRHESKQNQ